MITRKQIEDRLRLSVLNLCLAAAAGKEGDLTITQNHLFEQVEKMVKEAASVKT